MNIPSKKFVEQKTNFLGLFAGLSINSLVLKFVFLWTVNTVNPIDQSCFLTNNS